MAMNYDRRKHTSQKKKLFYIRNVRKFGFLEYMLRETQFFFKTS